MRILLVTTDIDRAETNMFLGLKKKGIALRGICAPQHAAIEAFRQAGIPVTPLVINKRFQPSAIRVIQQYLANEAVDIVHVLRKIALSNVIMATRHETVKIVAYRGIGGNLSTLDPISWMTFLHPRVNRVICVAEAVRQCLLNLGLPGLRLPKEKFVTIHKGHDVKWYRQDDMPDLRPLGVPQGVPVIGTVANMRPRKGIVVLIKAFEVLPPDLTPHLVLIGRVEDKKIIRAYRQSPVRDRIHLVGPKPQAWKLAKAFHVFIVPSLRREGLPRALIEAMSQGVPAIVTDVGGSPEVVQHDRSGVVVPPKDPAKLAHAIARILRNPALANTVGINAMKRIDQDFNIRQTIDRTLEVYFELFTPGIGLKQAGYASDRILKAG